MGRCQPSAELLRELNALVPWETPNAAQQTAQIFPIDVFHRQKLLALDFADTVNTADVRVSDLPREANFTEEILQEWAVIVQARRQEFQGDRVTEL